MNSYDAGYLLGSMLASGFAIVYFLIMVAILVLVIVAQWKIFTKAGEPGWACIVPIYNLYILYKISFGNGWLGLLNLIACIAPIMNIICMVKLAKAFNKGTGFTLGLIFLPFIFMLILGFGSDQYVGPN